MRDWKEGQGNGITRGAVWCDSGEGEARPVGLEGAEGERFHREKSLRRNPSRERHRTTTGGWGVQFSKIWKVAAPLKAKAMAWQLVRNRLPTMENSNKGLEVPEEERRCGCCKEKEKLTRHFFLGCLEVQRLWQKIVQWCGLCWVEPRDVHDHFMNFSTALGGGKTSLKMGGLYICVVWVMWKLRNAVKFE